MAEDVSMIGSDRSRARSLRFTHIFVPSNVADIRQSYRTNSYCHVGGRTLSALVVWIRIMIDPIDSMVY